MGWNGDTVIGTLLLGGLFTAGMVCAAIACTGIAHDNEKWGPLIVTFGFVIATVCALIGLVSTVHAVVSGEAPSLTDNHIEYRVCESGVCGLSRRIDCEAP